MSATLHVRPWLSGAWARVDAITDMEGNVDIA